MLLDVVPWQTAGLCSSQYSIGCHPVKLTRAYKKDGGVESTYAEAYGQGPWIEYLLYVCTGPRSGAAILQPHSGIYSVLVVSQGPVQWVCAVGCQICMEKAQHKKEAHEKNYPAFFFQLNQLILGMETSSPEPVHEKISFSCPIIRHMKNSSFLNT